MKKSESHVRIYRVALFALVANLLTTIFLGNVVSSAKLPKMKVWLHAQQELNEQIIEKVVTKKCLEMFADRNGLDNVETDPAKMFCLPRLPEDQEGEPKCWPNNGDL